MARTCNGAGATRRWWSAPKGCSRQVRRWLPKRALIVVADSSYAARELLAWCARQARPITVITRLRLDAALYAPAPVRRRGQRGRRRLKGQRVRKLSERLQDGRTRWQTCQLLWYGRQMRRLQLGVLPPKKRTRDFRFSWVFLG
jgi:hypothetical protein